MKFFSAILSVAAVATVSALPLELVYRSHHQARAPLPSLYSRSASASPAPVPDAVPDAMPTPEVPEPNPAINIDDPDTADSVYSRPAVRRRRSAIRARSAPVYEREAEPEPEVEEQNEEEDASTIDEEENGIVVDKELLRRLIEREEERVREEEEQRERERPLKAFRFHRRGVMLDKY